MSFIENKYYRCYLRIIDNAKNRILDKDGYVEKHHILPKSMGGSNKKENIIALTAKEHYVCHVLLTKCTTGYYLKLMRYALGKFIQSNKYQKRNFTARQYQNIRESISLARTGTTFSDESKKKMSNSAKNRIPWNKGLKGVIVHSKESNLKRSNTLKGRPISEEQKNKISNSKIGKPSGMIGKSHSEETKQKMREAFLRRTNKEF